LSRRAKHRPKVIADFWAMLLSAPSFPAASGELIIAFTRPAMPHSARIKIGLRASCPETLPDKPPNVSASPSRFRASGLSFSLVFISGFAQTPKTLKSDG